LPWILEFLFTFSAQAATIEGKVIKVADGDTVTILVNRQKHRIRLQGIDAPERKQPFGRASGRALSALVAGKQVRVEYDKRDRYGRIVGTVWVSSPDPSCNASPCLKNFDVGLHLFEQGLAWWY
jgi:endonuclease YncB( thermonuclease family)